MTFLENMGNVERCALGALLWFSHCNFLLLFNLGIL